MMYWLTKLSPNLDLDRAFDWFSVLTILKEARSPAFLHVPLFLKKRNLSFTDIGLPFKGLNKTASKRQLVENTRQSGTS